MQKALVAKFIQHQNLKQLLLSTSNWYLIEDSPYDSYWGIGSNGNGNNRLGFLLMKIREQLRSQAIHTTQIQQQVPVCSVTSCNRPCWFDTGRNAYSPWCSIGCRSNGIQVSVCFAHGCNRPYWFDTRRNAYSPWCSNSCRFC